MIRNEAEYQEASKRLGDELSGSTSIARDSKKRVLGH